MLRRSLTAPALSGDTLVVGDFDGYLHWLDATTGELLARGKTGGGRMSNAPVVVGDLLLLETDSGDVQAWRAKPPGDGLSPVPSACHACPSSPSSAGPMSASPRCSMR